MTVRIIHGCTPDALAEIPDGSIDACVTDPPYGIGFMGKEWDTFKPGTGKHRRLMHPRESLSRGKIVSDNPNVNGRTRSPALSPSQIEYDESRDGRVRFQDWCTTWAREVFRVLKPGGHLLCSGAPRSYHRAACGIEDAGFEVRDAVLWLFGSGFPKSLNVGCRCDRTNLSRVSVPVPDLPENRAQGQDTDLLVSVQREIEVSAKSDGPRVSLPEGNAAAGGGAEGRRELCVEGRGDVQAEQGQLHRPEVCPVPAGVHGDGAEGRVRDGASAGGGEAAGAMPVEAGSGASPGPQHEEQRGRQSSTVREQRGAQESGGAGACPDCGGLVDWEGWGTALKPAWEPIIMARKPLIGTVAARFFYCAKASRADRDDGTARNFHPTVKPTELMAYLCKLVTPPGGTILDPFMGSGSTGRGAVLGGFNFIGVKRETEYVEIARARIRAIAPLFEAATA